MEIQNSSTRWIHQLSEKFPDSVFIQDNSETYTYQSTLHAVENLTSLLKSREIEEGDAVGVLMNNSAEFIVSVLAIWELGAIPVPLNVLNSVRELTLQIQFADIRLTLCGEEFFSKMRLSVSCEMVKLTTPSENKASVKNGFNIEHTALRMFTSGSSGKPKLVELTFNNMKSSAESLEAIVGKSRNPVWLASLPFYHIGGFMIIIRALFQGGKVVIISNLKVDKIIPALSENSVNFFSVVSKTLKELLSSPVDFPKSIIAVFAGGGPVSFDLMSKANERGLRVFKVYGSTETCSMVSALDGGTDIDKLDSAGKPMPGVKISLSENDEIVINSKSIAKGYYKNPSETQARFKNGNYYAGDAGKFDEDGYLYILGRLDGAIITGGEKVLPAEVENCILANSEISECCVFGLQHPKWGEEVCAVLVVNNKIQKVDFLDKIGAQLARYKIPKAFYISRSIPRTELGKPDLKLLREWIKSGELQELI